MLLDPAVAVLVVLVVFAVLTGIEVVIFVIEAFVVVEFPMVVVL